MRTIEAYVRQHQEILTLVTDVLASLDRAAVQRHPSRVLEQIQRLAQALRMHLAQEDLGVYPILLRHTDVRVRETAQQFQDTMGGLSHQFEGFLERWKTSDTLQAAPEPFIQETRDLFEALAKRILSEDTILYPLAENPGQ